MVGAALKLIKGHNLSSDTIIIYHATILLLEESYTILLPSHPHFE
jgi:hypothetical protein